MQKLLRETFPLAILAGICISIGCVVNSETLYRHSRIHPSSG